MPPKETTNNCPILSRSVMRDTLRAIRSPPAEGRVSGLTGIKRQLLEARGAANAGVPAAPMMLVASRTPTPRRVIQSPGRINPAGKPARPR